VQDFASGNRHPQVSKFALKANGSHLRF